MTRHEGTSFAPTPNALLELPLKAADYVQEHGWTQGTMKDRLGRVCLTGALKECSTEPGDWHLIREVYRKRDRAESWNDRDGRTPEEVIAELRRPITGADLVDTFGPQAPQVVALVRQAATLTYGQAARLRAAWDAAGRAAWDAARDAAWDAARDAARDAAGDAAWRAAWDAARDAAGDAAWRAAWDAARDAAGRAARDAAGRAAWDAAGRAAGDAALALVVRDLLIQSPEGVKHYLTLAAPWREVVGHVHPDDAELVEN